MPVGHGVLVARAGGQQLAVIGDALGHVVVDAERRGDRHPLTVLELLRRQHVTARRSGALDAEQVVIPDRERALAPARFVDRLGDRHRRRDAVPALRRDGAWRDLADEGLLAAVPGTCAALGRRVVPGVRGSRRRRRAKGRAEGRSQDAPSAACSPGIAAVPARCPLPARVLVPALEAVLGRPVLLPRPAVLPRRAWNSTAPRMPAAPGCPARPRLAARDCRAGHACAGRRAVARHRHASVGHHAWHRHHALRAGAPVPPAVPTILAVPFLAAVPRPRAVPGAVAVPRPGVRPALAIWLARRQCSRLVPGTAASPTLAVTAPTGPAPGSRPFRRRWPSRQPWSRPRTAIPPLLAYRFAGLTSLSNSPLLTKPVTPWAASGAGERVRVDRKVGTRSRRRSCGALRPSSWLPPRRGRRTVPSRRAGAGSRRRVDASGDAPARPA